MRFCARAWNRDGAVAVTAMPAAVIALNVVSKRFTGYLSQQADQFIHYKTTARSIGLLRQVSLKQDSQKIENHAAALYLLSHLHSPL